MTSIVRITTVIIAALAATSAIAQPAGPLSVKVRYGDINLATPAGIAEFDRRIAVAINRVCPRVNMGDFRAVAAQRTCKIETAERTRPAVALVMARLAPTNVAVNLTQP